MIYENLKEVIGFAIEREKDAIYFYEQISRLTQFKNMTEELESIIKMEENHIKILLSIDLDNLKANSSDQKTLKTLSLAEYLVAGNAFEELTYQDLLILAMKRELASQNLYKKLAEDSETPVLKDLFGNLAYEEATHKLHFESIYDKEVLKEN